MDATIDAEYDDDFYARAARAELVDELGRKTVVEAEAYARFAFPVSPTAALLDSVARATIDGAPGVAHLDFLWPTAYAEHQRELAAVDRAELV